MAAAAAPVQGPVRAQHLTVELLPLSGSIQPGGNELVGLHFTLDKGWHVYWVNAGDSGEPPSIKWTLPAGITAGAMQFPAPRRLPLGPLMDFGYEDEVLFPITLSAASSLQAPSTAELSAHVDWLVCREVCIPGKADLALPLQVTAQKGTCRSWPAGALRSLPQPSAAAAATLGQGHLRDDSHWLCGRPYRPPCRHRRVFPPGSKPDRECRASTCPQSGRGPGDLSQKGRELPYPAGATERGAFAGGWNGV